MIRASRVDRAAMNASARIRSGERREIEPQSLPSRFQRAKRSWFSLELIDETIRLRDERSVAISRGDFGPRPVFVTQPEYAPATVVKLDLNAAFGHVELERALVGSLKLIQRIIDENVAVSRADVHRVFDRDVGQHLMCTVAEQAVGGSYNALHPVGRVRERVLDRSAPGFPIAIICL